MTSDYTTWSSFSAMGPRTFEHLSLLRPACKRSPRRLSPHRSAHLQAPLPAGTTPPVRARAASAAGDTTGTRLVSPDCELAPRLTRRACKCSPRRLRSCRQIASSPGLLLTRRACKCSSRRLRYCPFPTGALLVLARVARITRRLLHRALGLGTARGHRDH
jgi:hypothetical protein